MNRALLVGAVPLVLAGCDVVTGLTHVRAGPEDATPEDTTSPCFVETFGGGSVDATLWDLLSPNNGTVIISVQGGALVADITPGMTAYNGLVGKKAFDMVDGSAHVHVMPAYMGGFVETIFDLELGANTSFTMSSGAGNMNYRAIVDGAMTKMNMPFDAPQMAWWRFRHHAAASTITFDTSPDGNAWTERMTAPLAAPPSDATLQLTAGEYNAGLPVTTSARWDTLRVATPSCP